MPNRARSKELGILKMGESVRVLFSWEFVGPHHLARVRSCAELNGQIHARIFALADKSRIYNFYERGGADQDVTIAYRSIDAEDLSWWKRMKAYMRHVWGASEDAYFLCHYERLEVFLTAIVLRLRMKKVFVMGDSKFDDYQRRVFREAGKAIFYAPYNGALVSGERCATYLRFLGVRGKIETGYDTIDAKWVTQRRNQVSQNLCPQSFFIVINRLVKRKCTDLAIRAFAAFCRANEQKARLVIVGEGPEEQGLRELAAGLGIADRVDFKGALANEHVYSWLADAIALILASNSEQWGLVVNEAVTCGVPVIVSDAVGARDTLVRNFVNGFVIENGNVEGLSRAMSTVARDRSRYVPPADVSFAAISERFADAVSSLLGPK